MFNIKWWSELECVRRNAYEKIHSMLDMTFKSQRRWCVRLHVQCNYNMYGLGYCIEYQVKCVSDKDMDTKYRKLYYFSGELRRDMEIWWLRCLLFIWLFGQLLTDPMIKCPVIFLLRDTGNYSDNRTCLFDRAGNKVFKITEKAPTKTLCKQHPPSTSATQFHIYLSWVNARLA